jgi:hypothetical protein
MRPSLTSTSVTPPAPIPTTGGAARRAPGRCGLAIRMLAAPRPEVGIETERIRH